MQNIHVAAIYKNIIPKSNCKFQPPDGILQVQNNIVKDANI